MTRAGELVQGEPMRVIRFMSVLFALGWTAWSASIPDFVRLAQDRHGAAGESAARFLAEHMTESDRSNIGARQFELRTEVDVNIILWSIAW